MRQCAVGGVSAVESQALKAQWLRCAALGLGRVPRPEFSHHKGSCGRVAIIGGSEDYSGAPYLAAMSALRCGADLAYVFCPPVVAPILKGYSPDLVVRGLLSQERLPELLAALENCHSVVIGPGMGTAPATQSLFTSILDSILHHKNQIPVVLDACAVKMFAATFPTRGDGSEASLSRMILTPNENEFRVLMKTLGMTHQEVAVFEDGAASHPSIGTGLVHDVAVRLGGVTILRKGAVDSIGGVVAHEDHADETWLVPPLWAPEVVEGVMRGAPRRAGGQGDLLSGAVGAFSAFAQASTLPKSSLPPSLTVAMQSEDTHGDAIRWGASAVAASCVVKFAAHTVFKRPGMTSYIASDVLQEIGTAREVLLQL
mmetsp:Transcript_30664/g.35476  ORF Transcript_30664/g.35476 Transcript_30664/m.35476 type:complete len:371 (-) Transcript_30664:46-1158(-)